VSRKARLVVFVPERKGMQTWNWRESQRGWAKLKGRRKREWCQVMVSKGRAVEQPQLRACLHRLREPKGLLCLVWKAAMMLGPRIRGQVDSSSSSSSSSSKRRRGGGKLKQQQS
jgi:hypothetical protein